MVAFAPSGLEFKARLPKPAPKLAVLRRYKLSANSDLPSKLKPLGDGTLEDPSLYSQICEPLVKGPEGLVAPRREVAGCPLGWGKRVLPGLLLFLVDSGQDG